MLATSGLCSHVKACREASERRKKWESQVRWERKRRDDGRAAKIINHRASQDNNVEDGMGTAGVALTFFMLPHSCTTHLPLCDETRDKPAGAPEPGYITDNGVASELMVVGAPHCVNSIFRCGRGASTLPGKPTHASGPTPRNLLSPRSDRGTPTRAPEWCAQSVATRSSL
jgi:hypothetical protein